MTPSKILCAAVFLAFAGKFGETQTSCKDRCGAEYYRGYVCQCDYSCLGYGECCEDYESKCTTKNSCLGRCGETFRRGRLCSCDSDCMKYKQCCPDYKAHCDADDDYIIPLDSPTSDPTNDLADDTYGQIIPTDGFANNDVADPEAGPIPESSSGYGPAIDPLDPELMAEEINCSTVPSHPDGDLSILYPTTGEPTADAGNFTNADDQGTSPPSTTVSADCDSSQLVSTSVPESVPTPEVVTSTLPSDAAEVTTTNMQDSDTVSASTLASTAIAEETTSNSNTGNNSDDVTTDLHFTSSPSTPVSELDAASIQNLSTTAAAPEDTTHNVTPEGAKDTLKVTSPPVPEPTSKPLDTPDPSKPLPTSEPDTKPVAPPALSIDDPKNYIADDSNDTNLCSGRPVGGLTTLRNGTIVVFRGHYFWFLDKDRLPSPAQAITEVWGVPSPIDTVFTRCNCQGKTYIFKGGRYWRFENDVLDSGYPRVIKTGFEGLQGHITAALSVPQYQNKGESVYFFKRGGFVQKYSYQFGTSPNCGRKVNYSIYTVRARKARQAVSILEPAINIRTSWRGFPTTITAAVSVPSSTEPDGYKYIVFSRSKSYNVRLDGRHPVIATPKQNTSPQTSDVFRCPAGS